MPKPFSVMTFNIRTSLADDGPQNWRFRRPLAIRTVLDNAPDLLGIQEPTVGQWKDFAEGLGSTWTPVPHSRQDVHGKEPHLQGGFVRATRFEKMGEGCFWLSDTPEVPGSVTFPNHWGARACGWTRLRDRESGREFVFGVTHFDTHEDSWLPSARVLSREMDRAAAGLPAVVVGDFNCAAGSEPWRHLVHEAGFRDAWNEAGLADAGILTFNAFRPDLGVPLADPAETKRWLDERHGTVAQFSHYSGHIMASRNYRIDWILLKGPLRCTAARIDYRTEGALMPSDHYPVIATIDWETGQ